MRVDLHIINGYSTTVDLPELQFGLEDNSVIAPGFNVTKEQALAWLEKLVVKDN